MTPHHPQAGDTAMPRFPGYREMTAEEILANGDMRAEMGRLRPSPYAGQRVGLSGEGLYFRPIPVPVGNLDCYCKGNPLIFCLHCRPESKLVQPPVNESLTVAPQVHPQIQGDPFRLVDVKRKPAPATPWQKINRHFPGRSIFHIVATGQFADSVATIWGEQGTDEAENVSDLIVAAVNSYTAIQSAMTQPPLDQIRSCNFKDEHGHPLEGNVGFMALVAAAGIETRECPHCNFLIHSNAIDFVKFCGACGNSRFHGAPLVSTLTAERTTLVDALVKAREALERARAHFESIKIHLQGEDISNKTLDMAYSEAVDGYGVCDAALESPVVSKVVGGGK